MRKVKVLKKSENRNTFDISLSLLDGLFEEPVVGRSMIITSSTKLSGGIMTSTVTNIKKLEGSLEVETLNSTYIIEEVANDQNH